MCNQGDLNHLVYQYSVIVTVDTENTTINARSTKSCLYHQFQLTVKAQLLKLHWPSRLYDLSVCIFSLVK